MSFARISRVVMACALGAFLAANLIHNRGSVDPAIVPGVLFTALLFWTGRRVFLVLSAIALAVPAFGFFRLSALSDPSRAAYFFNHTFLLLAGVLAVTALTSGFVPNRKAATAAVTPHSV